MRASKQHVVGDDVLTWRFHEEATVEFDEAADYYLEGALEVGYHFISVFDAGVDRIRRMPFLAPTWPGRPDVRRLVLPRFPYSIVYTLERGEILIVAVAHAKRQPGYWLGRLH